MKILSLCKLQTKPAKYNIYTYTYMYYMYNERSSNGGGKSGIVFGPHTSPPCLPTTTTNTTVISDRADDHEIEILKDTKRSKATNSKQEQLKATN